MEQIHQVIGKLVRTFNIIQTYVDKDDPWSGILDAAKVENVSTKNMLKGYSSCQLVFGCDMIILIKYTVNWELIHHKKADANKYPRKYKPS